MPHLLVIEGPAFRETSGGHRAVIDRTYNGSGSGAPKSLNIENVGAVYDRPNDRPNQTGGR